MKFSFEVVDTVRKEEPDLFDDRMEQDIHNMLEEAIECEVQFANDLLSGGVVGMNAQDMRSYLEFIADQRLIMLGMEPNTSLKTHFHLWNSKTYRTCKLL